MNSNGSAATAAKQTQHFRVQVNNSVEGRTGPSLPIPDGRWIRPPIDVYEIDDALVVKAFIPEAHLSELDVTLEPNSLRLTGRLGWADAGAAPRVTWHRHELGSGWFAETVPLPLSVDVDRAAVTYDAGVLALVLPKATRPATRRIRVMSHQAVVDLG